jgi:hypothetical protein
VFLKFNAWRHVVTEAFESAYDEYGLDREKYPVAAIVALVVTFNEGMHVEMLSGIRNGHHALLELIDGWLEAQEARKRSSRRRIAGMRRARA